MIRLFALLLLAAGPALAQDNKLPPQFRSTELPLPRFASLKADKVYVRAGPGMQYPYEWVYHREGLPVEITQEFEQWRRIKDSEGAEGWINALMLSGKRNVLVRSEEPADMRDGASSEDRVIAKAQPGVIAAVKKCVTGWCQVNTGGFTGWMPRKSLWGIYDREELN